MTRERSGWLLGVLLGLVAGLVGGAGAFGQATTSGDARSDEGLPAPAGERVEPVLDAWWQLSVFYEVFVRSFADSTEGPLAGDGVGDLRGLIERLDYLNDGDPETDSDLGVTGIWLMPVCESPSYHGYDTLDYYTIEQDYGTNEDFIELMAECEARGIRVIVDLVLNHVSNRHPWFVQSTVRGSETRDWFIWKREHPQYRGPWGQGVWHKGRRGGWYYGCFYHGMPDLNYQNEEVTETMRDVTRFWIEDLGVDGFRLDAIRHLIEEGERQDSTPATFEWLESYQAFCKTLNPEVVTVGEVWSDSDIVSRYVGSGMDIAFEFSLADAIVSSVRSEKAAPLVAQLTRMEARYPLGMYATFLRNHDQPRVLHELSGDRDRAALAAMVQFCLPGVPFVYYGEEIGMLATKPDPQIRTPMQWTAGDGAGFTTGEPWIGLKPDYREINVEAQDEDASSLLSLYRRLIRLRDAEPALRTGALRLVDMGDPTVLAFERGDGPDGVFCLFNLGAAPFAFEASLDLMTGEPISAVPARSGVVIRGAAPTSRP